MEQENKGGCNIQVVGGYTYWENAMHGKTWPCKSKGDVNSEFNYLYTATLLNTHHLWIDADPVNRMCMSFKLFFIGLAQKMASSI
eukprot:4020895-Ditylum_brightwellii.AAC.1